MLKLSQTFVECLHVSKFICSQFVTNKHNILSNKTSKRSYFSIFAFVRTEIYSNLLPIAKKMKIIPLTVPTMPSFTHKIQNNTFICWWAQSEPWVWMIITIEFWMQIRHWLIHLWSHHRIHTTRITLKMSSIHTILHRQHTIIIIIRWTT